MTILQGRNKTLSTSQGRNKTISRLQGRTHTISTTHLFQTALSELGNRMTDWVDRLEDLITDRWVEAMVAGVMTVLCSPTEARIRAMNAFSSLLKLDKENQGQEFLNITEGWFR